MFPFGAILSGDPMGAYQKATGNKYALDKADIDQQADAAFGRSLQALYQGIAQQQQQGPQPQFQPQQSPQIAQQAPPQAPQPQGPVQAQIPGSQPIARPPGPVGFAPGEDSYGTPAPPAARMPPAQPQGGVAPQQPPAQRSPAPSSGLPGPQSQMGPQSGWGQLTLKQIIPAVQKALGPNADPSVFAAAVNKYLPLMNATSQEQWRGLQMELRAAQIQSAQGRLEQGQERLDLQRERQTQLQDARTRALDLRERKANLDEARFELQKLQVDQRFITAQKQLDEAKRKNDFNMVRQAAQALHNMVNERLQAYNVGLKQKNLQQDITELQAQSKTLFDAMHQAIDQHASTRGTPQGEVNERFVFPGDSSQ